MIIHLILLLKGQDCEHCVAKSLLWCRLDHLLHDSSPQEKALTYMPRRMINVSDWNDATSDYLTGFDNSEVCEIYHLFDINSRADDDGHIRISTGNTNQYGALCQYIFHPEELFLFLMTRCKKDGLSKTCATKFLVGIIVIGVMDGNGSFSILIDDITTFWVTKVC